MNKDEIIRICEKYKIYFYETCKIIPYEDKGIFNSEMLLFIALAKELNITEIWESGRARGQSTKILAECFKDIETNLHSIESLIDTDDDRTAKERLTNYRNLELIYGNSVILLPQKIRSDKETFVLIGGPKGTTAIDLASILLKKMNVKAVFLHDYHKDSPLREVIERTFENTFFTDDEDYVERFRDLDDNCWIEHAKIGRQPYSRNGRKMQSYSSTLGVIFNKR